VSYQEHFGNLKFLYLFEITFIGLAPLLALFALERYQFWQCLSNHIHFGQFHLVLFWEQHFIYYLLRRHNLMLGDNIASNKNIMVGILFAEKALLKSPYVKR
ncbi:MAG: hypothetical protein ABJH28_05775, partial [Paraglaciecola sp.]|uniref:hypothetical protein n=1 Tax=Paraglaciecola sp. TaxID=1920173 RepID=UPI003298CC15